VAPVQSAPVEAPVARAVVVETFAKAPEVGGNAGDRVTEVTPPSVGVETSAPVASSAPVVAPPQALTFEDEDDDLPRPGKVWDSSGPSLKELLAIEQAKQAGGGAAPAEAKDESFANVEPVGANDLQGVWKTLLDLMSTHGPMMQTLLVGGNLARVEGDVVTIRYSKKNETFTKILERNGKKDLVRDGLAKILGRPVGLRFEIVEDGPGEAAPAPQVRSAPPARPAPRAAAAPPPPPEPSGPPPIRITPEIIEEMKKDPLVGAVIEKLGGTPVKID
jgi:hypothetical protein